MLEVTVVVPNGKREPEGGVLVTGHDPVQLVAVVAKFTTAPERDVAWTVILDGTLMLMLFGKLPTPLVRTSVIPTAPSKSGLPSLLTSAAMNAKKPLEALLGKVVFITFGLFK